MKNNRKGKGRGHRFACFIGSLSCRHGLTNLELATRLGISPGYLTNICKGHQPASRKILTGLLAEFGEEWDQETCMELIAAWGLTQTSQKFHTHTSEKCKELLIMLGEHSDLLSEEFCDQLLCSVKMKIFEAEKS